MAKTLAAIVDEAQTLYDISGSAVLTTPQWEVLANHGYRKLWATVTAVLKSFRATSQSFTLSGTTQTQALPAGFRETLKVIRDPGTNYAKILTRFGDRTAMTSWERSYRVEGSNLVIEPLRNAAGSYQHLYIPDCPTLSVSVPVDDELDKFYETIVYYMVVTAMTREESETGGFGALLQEGYKDVKRWAADQRNAEPDPVDDVRGTRRATGWSW